MKKNAQSTIEYVVFTCIIVAVLFAMQVYIKRSLQGKLRDNVDQVSNGLAYSPQATNSSSTLTLSVNSTSKSFSETVDSVQVNTSASSSDMHREVVKSEEVLPFKDEPVR